MPQMRKLIIKGIPKSEIQYFIHYILCVIAFVVFSSTLVCNAQVKKLEIYYQKLNVAKSDSERVHIYYALSRFYWNINADSSLFMAEKSLTLAQKIHYDKGIALAYGLKGIALGYKGKWPEALDCQFKSLRISEKMGDEGLNGNIYNNIGSVYESLNDLNKALFYFQQSYIIALKLSDSIAAGTYPLLVNIGEVFKKQGQSDSAILYNTKALAIAKRVPDSVWMAVAMYNIAENHITKKQYNIAISFLYPALAIAKKINDIEDIAYCYNGLALTSYYAGNYDSSILYAQNCLEKGKVTGIVELEREAYSVLYLNWLKLNDYKKALYYRNLETTIKDSIDNAEKEKAIGNIQSAYDLQQKQQQINLLNKDKIIQQKEIREIRQRRNIVIAGSVFLFLLAIIFFRNYIQKRKLSEQLQDKNDHLEELVQVRNKLFSIIGHDLSGPIHSVRNVMDMIKSKKLTAEESEYFIARACENLSVTGVLLDNLLYWAKSQMDGVHVKADNFDITKVLEQNIALISPRAAEKKVTLHYSSIADPLTVYGDNAMIDIVTRNLLQNAVKFCKAGDTINLSTQKKGEEVVVCVKDTGKGIPIEDQAKIFNKNCSYTTFGTAKEKGSGLGLLLCKDLIEINGGSIWFESKPGQGTAFYYTIPTYKPE